MHVHACMHTYIPWHNTHTYTHKHKYMCQEEKQKPPKSVIVDSDIQLAAMWKDKKPVLFKKQIHLPDICNMECVGLCDIVMSKT